MKQITFDYLKRLNHKIKSQDLVQRAIAFDKLKTLEIKDLNAGLLMYNCYLQGKYHYLNYRRDYIVDSISLALECFRTVFKVARSKRAKVKNPKYYFKYAEALFLQSQYESSLFEQNKLLNKAYKIAYYSSKKYPENSSFNWLVHHIKNS